MPKIRKNSSEIIDASLTDSELVLAVRASDQQAFKQLYEKYYESLYKFIWRRIQDDEAARDFLQTLFIRVWKGRERLDPGQSIKAYLYQIATNLAIDYFRQKGKTNLILVGEFEEEPVEAPDHKFELEEEIERAVDDLPEPLKRVFKMSRFENMKNSEIAETLSISIKTVESRMTRAFTILHKQLKPFLAIFIFFENLFGK